MMADYNPEPNSPTHNLSILKYGSMYLDLQILATEGSRRVCNWSIVHDRVRVLAARWCMVTVSDV
jgi:hypothetical protein